MFHTTCLLFCISIYTRHNSCCINILDILGYTNKGSGQFEKIFDGWNGEISRALAECLRGLLIGERGIPGAGGGRGGAVLS